MVDIYDVILDVVSRKGGREARVVFVGVFGRRSIALDTGIYNFPDKSMKSEM